MPALPSLYPYKAGPIEPIVMPRETVGIWVNKTYKFYKVKFIEGIPPSDPIEVNFGALAAAATSNVVTQLTQLEMPDMEFGQFRCAILDDFAAILYQGRADQRHKMKNQVATYTRFGSIREPDGHTGEFYVFEDQWAFMQPQNQTDYNLTQTRAIFWGFRYVCEEFTDKNYYYTKDEAHCPPSWTAVPATAHL